MTSYSYIFGNLRTGEVIDEMPMFGVNVTKKLNDGGELRASFQFDQTGKDNEDLAAMTIPGRSFIVMEREGVPIWGGIVWSRTYQSQAKVCSIYCRGFEAYPEKQLMPNFTRLATEQRNIFRDLWNTLQADEERNIGIIVPSSFPTVIAKSVTVNEFDYKFFSTVMDEIANGDTGFDWTIDINRSEGVYIKTLRIGYPTLGTPVSAGFTVFEYPGSILNYYETASISSAATHVFGLGAGEGSTMLVSEQVHQDLLDNGWPRWDRDVPLKFITSQTTLDAVTMQEANIRKAPMTVDKISVKGNVDPMFGSYSLGDACKIVITDPLHTTGSEVTTRITQWMLRPQNAEQTEEVDLVFEGEDL